VNLVTLIVWHKVDRCLYSDSTTKYLLEFKVVIQLL